MHQKQEKLYMDSRSKENLSLVLAAKNTSEENERKLTSRMDTEIAGNLPLEYDPPDEIMEGMFIRGDGSIVYGDSNTGKTFVVMDMAAAMSQGKTWMGRRTEQGLVIYLAAESPSSVRRRLQAYQQHHNVRLSNFVVVKNPIDLFDGEADTNALIQEIHKLEDELGQKAIMIVGDTLARLSAGANENSGEHMGVVIRHFDKIRAETEAHFILIHHSGKNAAAGARGWSGVRAAVDTEIEVTDSPDGKCIEVTKQRDLDSKGVRIGFKLEPITLGKTKWGTPASSCVVMSTDAPVKKKSAKKVDQAMLAIDKYINSDARVLDSAGLAEYFAGQYGKTVIYDAIKQLIEIGMAEKADRYIIKKKA